MDRLHRHLVRRLTAATVIGLSKSADGLQAVEDDPILLAGAFVLPVDAARIRAEQLDETTTVWGVAEWPRSCAYDSAVLPRGVDSRWRSTGVLVLERGQKRGF